MTVPTRIVVGVAGGYLLGRTKKLRLALALGGALAGRRLAAQRGDLLAQGSKLMEGNPQLKALQGQLTGKLVEVAREAALVAAASRVEALTKSLESRQRSGGQEDAAQGEQSGGGSGDQPQGRADEQGESQTGDESSSAKDDESAQDKVTRQAPAIVAASAKRATPRNVAKKVSAKKPGKRSSGEGR